jgi:plasmid stability protein
MRAAHHRRSREAVIRDILKRTILPVDRLRIGSTVAILSLEVG